MHFFAEILHEHLLYSECFFSLITRSFVANTKPSPNMQIFHFYISAVSNLTSVTFIIVSQSNRVGKEDEYESINGVNRTTLLLFKVI